MVALAALSVLENRLGKGTWLAYPWLVNMGRLACAVHQEALIVPAPAPALLLYSRMFGEVVGTISVFRRLRRYDPD